LELYLIALVVQALGETLFGHGLFDTAFVGQDSISETLIAGMKDMGFRPFLDARIQAPIIVTFHAPADPRYAFKAFYDKVRDKGFILYPGKLTQLETFRVGCIGAIGPDDMRHAVNAVRDALSDLGIRQVAPAAVKAA